MYVLPHYAELGISLYAMSVIIFAARISDAFTDPLIGVLSDKKSPGGGDVNRGYLPGRLVDVVVVHVFCPPDHNTEHDDHRHT